MGGLPVPELDAEPIERLEWLVSDVSLARALFSGVPVARLLARARLGSDEREMASSPRGAAPPVSAWDDLLKRLLGTHPAALDRLKRQVARHARTASDEGPLHAAPGVVAALVYAEASALEDASLAEALALDVSTRAEMSPSIARAVGGFDARLARVHADARGPLFEACIHLAARMVSAPITVDRLLAAHESLLSSELHTALLRPSNVALYPRDFEADIPRGERRMALLERAELDVLLARDPRELAASVARAEKEKRGLDSLLADLGKLLAIPGDLVLAAPLADPLDEALAAPPPSGAAPSAPSWMPTAWTSPDAGQSVAEGYERGVMTLPRLRATVARGGDEALDAIGAEMLKVDDHPFASATFAELLARSGRPRDVVRLVTYFAVAPDPYVAARALSTCAAPELPLVLRSWLEAMLPTDGAPAPLGEDPQTSSAAWLTACISSLAPYPQLYRVVSPLLARVSERPPPSRP